MYAEGEKLIQYILTIYFSSAFRKPMKTLSGSRKRNKRKDNLQEMMERENLVMFLFD